MGVFFFMVGWVVVIGGVLVESMLMFFLIFMWMLLYFWVLCIFMKIDYCDVGVLMLNVIYGCLVIWNYIFVYMLFLVVIVIGMGFIFVGGLIYFVIVLVLNVLFVFGVIWIWCCDDVVCEVDEYKVEKCFFGLLFLYLFLYFGVIMVEVVLVFYGFGGW